MSARSFARLRKVQGELVRLAELRLAAAERACHDLDAARARLDGFVAEGEAACFTQAALRSLKAVGAQTTSARAERVARQERLVELRRRDGALEAASRRATLAARRGEEARALAEVVEAMLAARGTADPAYGAGEVDARTD